MDNVRNFRDVEGKMSSPASSTGYHPDSRGNRLESWTATQAGSGHVLWLRGPEEATRQVLALAPEYQRLPASTTANSWWTHALQSPSVQVADPARSLLDLLTKIITLPTRANLDFAVALDWYKVPEEGVDPRQWSNTAAGELINTGKYRYKFNADRQKEAGLAVVDMMCRVIERHGVLQQAEVILDVPGHDTTRVSFGSRVAETIAMRRGIPMLRVRARSEFRPEAKSLKAADRADVLRDQFVVPGCVYGKSALIVDDVFKTGTSIKEVARAARESQASAVQGICCVRTMSAR